MLPLFRILLVCLYTGAGLAAEVFEDHDQHEHDVHHEHVCSLHDDLGSEEDHAGHAHDMVELTPAQAAEAGLAVAPAAPAAMASELELYGVIAVNDDRYAHILSRVPGTVVDVHVRMGDAVTAGMVLAVVDSTELADAKAEFLAAHEEFALQTNIFSQEEEMWRKGVAPLREYLNAKRDLAHARIALRSARQKLFSFGFDDDYLRALPDEPECALTRFFITAPFDGTIIDKHVTRGEVLKPDSEEPLFAIADLSTVWCDLRVPQLHLGAIRTGQSITISAGPDIPLVRTQLAFVGPLLNNETRTALARAVITNTAGLFRPGLFVTARLSTGSHVAPVCVPRGALQIVDGNPVVFVRDAHGYLIRPVIPGARTTSHVEIRSGLSPGELVVTNGAFALKAHLVTSGMDAHAGHGH